MCSQFLKSSHTLQGALAGALGGLIFICWLSIGALTIEHPKTIIKEIPITGCQNLTLPSGYNQELSPENHWDPEQIHYSNFTTEYPEKKNSHEEQKYLRYTLILSEDVQL